MVLETFWRRGVNKTLRPAPPIAAFSMLYKIQLWKVTRAGPSQHHHGRGSLPPPEEGRSAKRDQRVHQPRGSRPDLGRRAARDEPRQLFVLRGMAGASSSGYTSNVPAARSRPGRCQSGDWPGMKRCLVNRRLLLRPNARRLSQRRVSPIGAFRLALSRLSSVHGDGHLVYRLELAVAGNRPQQV